MSSHSPRVSVALPVFDGENYLSEALDSILAQTYGNFEIIISDNGSTDRTQEICRGYAERDPRVRYLRSDVNRGVYWNFRRGFECAQGEFFMWLAHDDKLAPEFLERCVAALDQDAGAVLSYPKAVDIDEQGNHLVYKDQEMNGGAVKPHERFRGSIRMEHNCEAIFGLIRMDLLKKIPVFGNFADADRVMLAEMSLHGRYSQIPEFLFLHREHPLRTTNVYPQSRFQRTAILLSYTRLKIIFPHFRQFGEYVACIHRAPLSWRERLACYCEMLRWLRQYWRRMVGDVKQVLIFVLRRVLARTADRRKPAVSSGPNG